MKEKRGNRNCLFLRAYQATPHSSSKISPGDALFREGFQTRFINAVCINVEIPNITAADEEAKAKMKAYADRRRRTTFHDLHIDDIVYIRKKCHNKLMSAYDLSSYNVLGIKAV